MNVQTYLIFDGRCEEAIEFYREVLRAEVLMLMRFDEAPAGLVPAGFLRKVFHATIRIGGTVINAADNPKTSGFEGFALLLHLEEDAAAERAFGALGEGGEVQLAMGSTAWASRYGIARDRFGVMWKVQSGGNEG